MDRDEWLAFVSVTVMRSWTESPEIQKIVDDLKESIYENEQRKQMMVLAGKALARWQVVWAMWKRVLADHVGWTRACELVAELDRSIEISTQEDANEESNLDVKNGNPVEEGGNSSEEKQKMYKVTFIRHPTLIGNAAEAPVETEVDIQTVTLMKCMVYWASLPTRLECRSIEMKNTHLNIIQVAEQIASEFYENVSMLCNFVDV